MKEDAKVPVQCVETGQRFESMADAAAWSGVRPSGISQSIEKGYIAGKYHWWYADQPIPEGHFKTPQKRPIQCVETGQVFESLAKAAKWGETWPASIRYSIKNDIPAGGYHWKYA